MHFWIDKRSQTCGFSGRHRVPSSLSAGACRPNVRCSSSIWGGACSVGGGGCSGGGGGGVGVGSCPRPSQSKSMVTPVHRFQSIESAAIAGSSRPSRHAAYPSPARLHRLRSPPFTGVSGPNHGADNHGRHETPDRGGGGVHVADIVDDAPLDASEHRRAGHRLAGAHSSATPDTLHGPHLVYPNYRNRSIWISVTLLTALSGCALFLINREVSFGEIVMFTAIFLLALFASFYVSLCHRPVASWEMLEALVVQPLDQTSADGANARVVAGVDLSTESVRSQGVRNDPTAEHQVSQEDLVMNSILRMPSPPGAIASVASVGPPPPPYHIAILLPEQTSGVDVSRIVDESPPPSYEKAVS